MGRYDDEAEWATGLGVILISIVLGSVATLLRIIIGGVVGVYRDHGHHPLLRWALGLWVLLLVLSFVIATAWVAVISTFAFLATVTVADAALTTPALPEGEGEVTIEHLLSDSWGDKDAS